MAQKRARSRSQVPRTFSALLSLLLVTQAAPPNAPLNMSSAPLYPSLTPALWQPQLPVKVGGEVSNSNTAEANGTLYGGEDDEVIRFVAPHDDPQEGCATCDGCKEVRDKGQIKVQKHSCWKAGKRGQAIVRENARREAAVAAELEAGFVETSDAAPAIATVLAPGDDPMQGCADCPVCTAINTPKNRASGSHTCWKKGMMGQASVKEQKRRDAMLAAALAAGNPDPPHPPRLTPRLSARTPHEP